MEKINLVNDKDEARGRNGWFIPKKALVDATETHVTLDLESRRPARVIFPVHIVLEKAEAAAIARAILQVAGVAGQEEVNIVIGMMDGMFTQVAVYRDPERAAREAEELRKVYAIKPGEETNHAVAEEKLVIIEGT